MAAKHARSSGAVRPAFGRVEIGDGDAQRPARQSRRGEADAEAQRAALAYGARLEADVRACPFCYGETDQGDKRAMHERSCPFR